MARSVSVPDRIRQIAKGRSIHSLLHFTQLQNLPNIIQHGILPREVLYDVDFDAHASADYQLNGKYGAVSLSISAVSEKIFSAKTKKSTESDWVVLFIDPSILWTHDCRFCFRNAATKKMKNHRGRLDGPWALEQMFSDEMAPPNFKGTSYRAVTDIPNFLTTDPDAEVQVFGRVAPETIKSAWGPSSDLAETVQNELNRLSGPERDVLADEFTTTSNGYSGWIRSDSML